MMLRDRVNRCDAYYYHRGNSYRGSSSSVFYLFEAVCKLSQESDELNVEINKVKEKLNLLLKQGELLKEDILGVNESLNIIVDAGLVVCNGNKFIGHFGDDD